MADFHKKAKNPYRNFFIKLGAVALLVVLVVLIVWDIKIYQKKRELDAQLAALSNKVQELKTQNSQLQETTAHANDDAYIEKIAREELDLQQPGEKVFSFVPAPGQGAAPATPKNIWQAWIGGALNAIISIFKK